jgi:hypothetical protein
MGAHGLKTDLHHLIRITGSGGVQARAHHLVIP